MTALDGGRGRLVRGAVMAVSVAVGAFGLSACSARAAGGDAPHASATPSVPTPMATSIDTAHGTWVTLPMGRLDEALNTFWQLFFRPAPTGSWSNQVEATATATNGGLVLAPTGSGGLVVGIRPSSYLTYTPLIATPGASSSWSDGLIEAGLAARPDALATSGSGDMLALVGGADARVLTSKGDLSTWATMVDRQILASTPSGRACGLDALTAVGYRGNQPMVGANCRRPGEVGLYAKSDGRWHPAGIILPPALSHDRVEVLALESSESTASALLAVSDKSTTALVAAWSATSGSWITSSPLRLSASESVVSFGPASGNGLFALVQSASGHEALAVLNPPESTWQELPSPPVGTATVAFGPASSVAAFVGSGTVLTVWSLDSTPNRWGVEQVIHVPIQYGSSSQ